MEGIGGRQENGNQIEGQRTGERERKMILVQWDRPEKRVGNSCSKGWCPFYLRPCLGAFWIHGEMLGGGWPGLRGLSGWVWSSSFLSGGGIFISEVKCQALARWPSRSHFTITGGGGGVTWRSGVSSSQGAYQLTEDNREWNHCRSKSKSSVHLTRLST